MRIVFPVPKEDKSLDGLLLSARHNTGIVTEEPLGFKVWLGDGRYHHIFFHKDYRELSPEDLRGFPDLFEASYDKIHYDGLPSDAKPVLADLMAANEHWAYVPTATVKLPGQILAEVTKDRAELGAWGVFDYIAFEKAREEMIARGELGCGSVEEYLAKTMPVFTRVKEQPAILASLRVNRPGGKNRAEPGIQPQVFQSVHYGNPGNPEALRDVLFSLMQSGKLDIDKRSLDTLVRDPYLLPSRGIGGLVNGAAIILSLDSEENNRKYSAVLDNPLSTKGYIRDLSLLGFAGVKAFSIVNRFSSLVRDIDSNLIPHLDKMGYEIPKGPTEINGKPIVAEGICIVTYSAGFETDYKDMTIEKIVALYESMRLAIKRVMQQKGYESASYMIGENVGPGGAQTLQEKHIQAYVSRKVNIRPQGTRIKPTEENVLYDNESVHVIADPASYSQIQIQFKDKYDKPFHERTIKELRDFAEARVYNFERLNGLGVTSDRNVYMSGNDFVVRPVPDNEKTLRLGFFERGSGMRVVSLTKEAPTLEHISPLEVAARIPGDQQRFIELYRAA